jgi:hypothetical protein
MGLVKDKMMSERDRIVRPFIGKWIKTEVKVDDVSLRSSGGVIWADGVKMLFAFKNVWRERLDILTKGQTVEIIGKIKEIRAVGFECDDCEFLDT